jgi:hypothetical protein
MNHGGGGGKDKAHGGGGGGDKVRGGGGDHSKSARVETRGNGNGKDRGADAKVARADRAPKASDDRGKSAAKADRERGNGRDAMARDDRRDERLRDRDDVRVVRSDDRDRFDWREVEGRGFVQDCPPGLAKKNNGCMPPGQLKARNGFAFADRPDWWGFDDYQDGRFAYWNGSLVRLGDDGLIGGYLPLLGGALAPGNVWPSSYGPVTLPSYYQDYYGLGAPSGYRYYDDTLFRIDPETQAITSIAALLTGDQFAIGQPLPSGYDLYNVPYSYRDQYADGPDSMYRYSDGYVYEVDPTTQLITAAIELLT